MNENYDHPSLGDGVAAAIIKGMYRFSPAADGKDCQIRLLGSGAILREVIAAAKLLQDEWNIASEVWSVTSFSELAREAREVQRWNRLHPTATSRTSFVADCLVGRTPVLAATDYVSAYPSLIAPFVEASFVVLGTDGFGRSDTRASLRRFFEVDRHSIVVAALRSLMDGGQVKSAMVASAIEHYQLPIHDVPPWTR
jgi:pyruvate dehydrogenase E1 component